MFYSFSYYKRIYFSWPISLRLLLQHAGESPGPGSLGCVISCPTPFQRMAAFETFAYGKYWGKCLPAQPGGGYVSLCVCVCGGNILPPCYLTRTVSVTGTVSIWLGRGFYPVKRINGMSLICHRFDVACFWIFFFLQNLSVMLLFFTTFINSFFFQKCAR